MDRRKNKATQGRKLEEIKEEKNEIMKVNLLGIVMAVL